MKPLHTQFLSKHRAEQIVPTEFQAIVSIVEPGEVRNLHPDWKHVVRLDFHDTDADANGGQTWSVLRATPDKYVRFDNNHAEKIIKFLDNLHPDVTEILVHCHAGISRSAAVSKYIAELYGLRFNHDYSLYNKHVYKTLRNYHLNLLPYDDD